jgi:hypothetical protein
MSMVQYLILNITILSLIKEPARKIRGRCVDRSAFLWIAVVDEISSTSFIDVESRRQSLESSYCASKSY